MNAKLFTAVLIIVNLLPSADQRPIFFSNLLLEPLIAAGALAYGAVKKAKELNKNKGSELVKTSTEIPEMTTTTEMAEYDYYDYSK